MHIKSISVCFCIVGSWSKAQIFYIFHIFNFLWIAVRNSKAVVISRTHLYVHMKGARILVLIRIKPTYK